MNLNIDGYMESSLYHATEYFIHNLNNLKLV